MKNIFKYILLSGAAAATLTSCNLDLFPNSSINYKEGQDIITSESDLTSFRNGLMASFRGHQKGTYVVTSDVMMDGFNATTDYANHYGDPHRQEAGKLASDYDIEDHWTANYGTIKNCNIFIDGYEDIKNEDLKKKATVVKGYAHLIRANSYMNLARFFGAAYDASTAATAECVPLILHFDVNELPERATVKDIFAQIKADLDEAASCLASQAGAVRSEFPTIDAVKAEYARYFITIKDYANAEKYATEVLNSPAGYKLASSDKEFAAEFISDKGNEPILQFYISKQEKTNATTDWTGLRDMRSEGYDYVYDPYFIPSAKLINAYDESDLRLKNWYTKDKRYSYITGSYYKGNFYTFIRHEGNPDLENNGIPAGYNASKPYTISEMYLIAAEALAMSNKTTEAAVVLNELQAARGAEPTDGSMESVKKEWFRETAGLGMRLFCLKRWGDGFGGPREPQAGALADGIVTLGERFTELNMPAGDFHLVWPIPTYEFQVNDKLKGHQNPGYGEGE